MEEKEYLKLYEEYKKIDTTINYAFQVYDRDSNIRRDIRPAPPLEDMYRHKELSKILLDCKDYLQLDVREWYRIKKNAME
ncbi:MAG: hypothetical protein V4469_02355 [Patescibacteria group bacterium]